MDSITRMHKQELDWLAGFKYTWKVTYDGRTWVHISNQIRPTEGMEKIPYYVFDWLDFWGDINLVGGPVVWEDTRHGIRMEYIGEIWRPEE